MLTLQAAALSDALLLPTEKITGQVKTIHKDYVNIMIPSGIITLARAGMPHIPFSIEVKLDRGWLDSELLQNHSVLYDGNAIIFEKSMTITGLRKCPRFSCKPSYDSLLDNTKLVMRLQYLQRLCNSMEEKEGIIKYLGQYDAKEFCNSLAVFDARIPERVKVLISGVLEGNELLLIEGICGLLGVGPGSTPSGDDFLLGFLSSIVHIQRGKYQQAAEKMAYHMVENAKNLTTFLSIEYIKYGVKDLYHQYFSEFISAFVAGTEEELMRTAQALLTLGHSSGTDLLVGFIYGAFTALSADITAQTKGEKNEHL